MIMCEDRNMIRVYAAQIGQLPDPREVPECLEGLSEDRKQKCLRCFSQQKRKQSLGVGLLLQYVLKRQGKPDVRIRIGQNGKPEADGIYFNLSHAGQVVICAVGDVPVGCDVEQLKKEPRAVAERFFCESEKNYLDTLGEEERTRAFFRIWTMKESYMKMTGEGLSLGMDRIECKLSESAEIYRDRIPCSCRIREYEIPGYCCCVCAETQQVASAIEWIELS